MLNSLDSNLLILLYFFKVTTVFANFIRRRFFSATQIQLKMQFAALISIDVESNKDSFHNKFIILNRVQISIFDCIKALKSAKLKKIYLLLAFVF